MINFILKGIYDISGFCGMFKEFFEFKIIKKLNLKKRKLFF